MKKSLIFITIIISMCLILPNSDVNANEGNIEPISDDFIGPLTAEAEAEAEAEKLWESITSQNDVRNLIGVIEYNTDIDSCQRGCNIGGTFELSTTISTCEKLCALEDLGERHEFNEVTQKPEIWEGADHESVTDWIPSTSNEEECYKKCEEETTISEPCKMECDNYFDSLRSDEGAVSEWDKLFATATNPAECGGIMTSRFLELLVQVYNTIILVAGILAIILGASDFLKATGSDEKDSLNKSFKKLMTRLVILIILFILPQIIIFILDTFGDEAMKTCLEHF